MKNEIINGIVFNFKETKRDGKRYVVAKFKFNGKFNEYFGISKEEIIKDLKFRFNQQNVKNGIYTPKIINNKKIINDFNKKNKYVSIYENSKYDKNYENEHIEIYSISWYSFGNTDVKQTIAFKETLNDSINVVKKLNNSLK